MGAVCEHISADRPERAQRDPPAARAAHSAGAAIVAPGAMLDGIGNRALLALLRSGRLRRKARISEPGDAAEHDADRVARQVMRMPARHVPITSAPPQASCNCAVRNEDEQLLRKESDASEPAAAEASSVVQQVVRSPGQPLDTATRAYFEPRFQQDFSRVRVHTDSQATASAQAVQARAHGGNTRCNAEGVTR